VARLGPRCPAGSSTGSRQYLLFAILVAAASIRLLLPRPDRVGLAVQAIVSAVIAVVLIKSTAAIHADPRPFVAHPSIKPLFAHRATMGSHLTTPHWLPRSRSW